MTLEQKINQEIKRLISKGFDKDYIRALTGYSMHKISGWYQSYHNSLELSRLENPEEVPKEWIDTKETEGQIILTIQSKQNFEQ